MTKSHDPGRVQARRGYFFGYQGTAYRHLASGIYRTIALALFRKHFRHKAKPFSKRNLSDYRSAEKRPQHLPQFARSGPNLTIGPHPSPNAFGGRFGGPELWPKYKRIFDGMPMMELRSSATGEPMEILNPFGKRPAPAPRRQPEPVQDQDADTQSSPLSEVERAELAAAESRIQRGLSGFIDAGAALSLIKDNRLYRDTHATYEGYLRDRWGLGTDYANKLVHAMTIALDLERKGFLPPVRETHAREIGRVQTDHRAKVWGDALAAAGGDPQAVTADMIAQATPKRLRKVKGNGKQVKARPPKPIKIRGRGWIITIERRKEIDPSTILAAAEMQLRNRSIKAAA